MDGSLDRRYRLISSVHARQVLVPHEEDTRTLGPEQPLMSVRRQKIDARSSHIKREDAKSLNRIQKEQAAATPA